MADDEQFSLCWNNFNSNLSAGFHESLCRGDLVDVTLAAEGQFVKAHRLVLSVCSPYFRKMFTQMPANQHAFVFLKDVSHTALKDLIQFMYCGEVNVKQEALPAFISTAEALQIKGLTDSDPPQSQSPPEPSTPTPQIQQIHTSPRIRQRSTTSGRSYKIETVEDSGDDANKQTTQIVIQTAAPPHPPQATITTQPAPQPQQHHHHHQQQQTQHLTQQALQTQTHQITSVSMPTATTTTAVVTHKRPAQRTSLGSVPHIKRTKSTIDPLEAAEANAATQQINVQTTVVATEVKSQAQHHHQQQQHQVQQHHHQAQQQQTNDTEYIDLPIELPTKSEPDYAEEAGDVDQGDQDGTYVEDESYGDIRYDENYFTEGEDATGAGNAAAGGASAGGAAATTSKAIVKQQPMDYMDTTDQGNSDAQDSTLSVSTPNAEKKRQVHFSLSRRGGKLMWMDGVKYFRHCENQFNYFWRCHWYYRRVRCPVLICMNKNDSNDFRQVNSHCHVESSKAEAKSKVTKPSTSALVKRKKPRFTACDDDDVPVLNEAADDNDIEDDSIERGIYASVLSCAKPKNTTSSASFADSMTRRLEELQHRMEKPTKMAKTKDRTSKKQRRQYQLESTDDSSDSDSDSIQFQALPRAAATVVTSERLQQPEQQKQRQQEQQQHLQQQHAQQLQHAQQQQHTQQHQQQQYLQHQQHHAQDQHVQEQHHVQQQHIQQPQHLQHLQHHYHQQQSQHLQHHRLEQQQTEQSQPQHPLEDTIKQEISE